MLVGNGDLVDADDGFLDGMDRPFQEIRPRLGKYAVLGNHEFLWDTDDALAFLGRAGFRTIRGEYLRSMNRSSLRALTIAWGPKRPV